MKKDMLSVEGLKFDNRNVTKRPSLFGRSNSAFRRNKNSYLNATANSLKRSPSVRANETNGSIGDFSINVDDQTKNLASKKMSDLFNHDHDDNYGL